MIRRTRRRPPAGCTIVAQNYLALARVLSASYLEHHPGASFYVLVVDGERSASPAIEGSEIITPDELGLPYLYDMCFKYNVTELSTALKPSLLTHILGERRERHVVYLDPDILVMRPLDVVRDALARSDIVLTPHLLRCMPLDGKTPSEQDILVAGAYNLGFIGVREGSSTREFLAWWQERLRDHCQEDPWSGLMTDQRWIDLVPSFYPNTHVVRDDTYNVAYWNLHERLVERSRSGRGYTVNGAPLTFFHFSGHNPRRPGVISKHQTRHSLEGGSPLAELFAEYDALVLEQGFDEAIAVPYGFGSFDDGVRIDNLVRRAWLDLPDDERTRYGDPFRADGSFRSWLVTPGDSPNALSPYLERLYGLRFDVAAAFPDVTGTDHEAFLQWALEVGPAEEGFDRQLVLPALPGALVSVEDRTAPDVTTGTSVTGAADLPGVTVCGYLSDESGLGSAARGYVRALDALGVDTSLSDVSELSVNRSTDTSLVGRETGAAHDVKLVCVNADEHFTVKHWHPEIFADGYRVGVWAWELAEFPSEWRDRLDEYDELWVGTSFIANTLARVSPVPVVRIPPALELDVVGSRERGRDRLGIDETTFTALFMFDFHSYFERKNPMAVVESFKKAFSPGEPACLVIKCVNGRVDVDNFRRLLDEVDGHRIRIIPNYLPASHVADLVAACDTYVSLHRSEGTGLTIAEAMRAGKPVVATAWSGNVDFTDVSNSCPVQYELVELEHDIGPYRAGCTWAEPSMEDAAFQLRRLYEDPQWAVALGKAGQRTAASHFSAERVGSLIRDRLAVISRTTRRRPPAHDRVNRPPQTGNGPLLEPLRELVRTHAADGAVVAVVSKGDQTLLTVSPGRGWHFPQTVDGVYAGYHPPDSASAIGHLEQVRQRGATHLLVPATSAWWLDFYDDFARHLQIHHELVGQTSAGTLYQLRSSGGNGSNP